MKDTVSELTTGWEVDVVFEASIETVFRYAHVYPRALSLMESGKINVKPLITDRYNFNQSIATFDYAVKPAPTNVKVVIEM